MKTLAHLCTTIAFLALAIAHAFDLEPLTNHVRLNDRVYLSISDESKGSVEARIFDTEVEATNPLEWVLHFPTTNHLESATLKGSDLGRFVFLGMDRKDNMGWSGAGKSTTSDTQ